MFTPKYQLNDRQMAVLLASLVAVMPFSVDAYLPSTLDIARALGAQTHDIERSLSAFMLGVAIGQLSGGSLSDIKGRRNIALKGLLVYVVSSLALVFVQTADQLLLLRLVQALGAGMASVVVGAVVRDNYRGNQAAQMFAVIGIIDDTKRLPELLAGVVIPTRTAQALWHDPPPEAKVNLVVDVAPGAAQVVGPQLLTAMSATHPERFSVSLPPSPEGLRAAVNSQLSGLFLGLGVVCLIVGMIGIANTTIVAVIERTGEIGLRRAMGAQPRHIAAQFLLEAAVLGGLGGLVGTSLGVVAVVGICAALTWTAVVPPLLVAAGPLVGLVAGTLAGIYPSLRASRLEPVEALRY